MGRMRGSPLYPPLRRGVVIAGVLLLMICTLALGSTVYVDDGPVYHIDWSGGAWGTIVQPTVEWRLAEGIDWDTTGAGIYRNYGSGSLATGLTDGTQPGLTEGILAEGQTALDFDGVNDYLYINSSSVLDLDRQDFTVAIWVHVPQSWTDSYAGIIWKKGSYSGGDYARRGWGIAAGYSSPGVFFNVADGSDYAGMHGDFVLQESKWYYVVGVCDWGSNIYLYVDGDLKETHSITSVDSTNNTNNLQIGKLPYYPWQSGIALVQIWEDLALGSTAIDSLYTAMNPTGSASITFPSFQSAVYQSSAGDTILGIGGRYRETLEIVRNLSIYGDVTDYGFRPELYGADLPAAAGTNAITVLDTVEIGYLNIRAYTSGCGVYADSISDGSVFHHLGIDSCDVGVAFFGTTDGDSLVNCTVDCAELSGSRGIKTIDGSQSVSQALVFYNNIIVAADVGIEVSDSFSVDADYNNLFANTTDLDGIDYGAHDLLYDPLFKGGNDYRPYPYARVIDRGSALRFPALGICPDIGAWEVRQRSIRFMLTADRRLLQQGRYGQ